MAREAPQPDTEHRPTIAGQTLVEVNYSENSHVRGIITLDANGVYRVRTEFWDTGDWEVAGVAYWGHAHLGTFADTLDNARALCREAMAATATS